MNCAVLAANRGSDVRDSLPQIGIRAAGVLDDRHATYCHARHRLDIEWFRYDCPAEVCDSRCRGIDIVNSEVHLPVRRHALVCVFLALRADSTRRFLTDHGHRVNCRSAIHVDRVVSVCPAEDVGVERLGGFLVWCA